MKILGNKKCCPDRPSIGLALNRVYMPSNYHPIEGDLFTVFTALKKRGISFKTSKPYKKEPIPTRQIRHLRKGEAIPFQSRIHILHALIWGIDNSSFWDYTKAPIYERELKKGV